MLRSMASAVVPLVTSVGAAAQYPDKPVRSTTSPMPGGALGAELAAKAALHADSGDGARTHGGRRRRQTGL